MIQVLGLRDSVDNKGRPRKSEVFFNKGWRFNTIDELFDTAKRNQVIDNIPVEERFNLYFTVADCFEESGRKLKEQHVVHFDIDGLDLPEELTNEEQWAVAEKAVRCACEVLGVDFYDISTVFTGNGAQFFIKLDVPILSETYFEETRPNYALLAERIQCLLDERGIKGKVDTSVWSKGRLMRMPDTENRKPGKPTRIAKVLHNALVPKSYDIVEISGVPAVKVGSHVPDEVLKNYPKPDTEAVCTGCKFLVHCSTKPAQVSEPEWYAMLSITSRLENGEDISHKFSEGHPQYSHYETELKIEQAQASAGPRTCKNIEYLWGECNTCDYYGKVTSPIMIKGDGYIASVDFGFRERKINKDGKVVPGKPAYMDLVRTYQAECPYKVIADNGLFFKFDGKKWVQEPQGLIRAWAMKKIRPEPSVSEMNEFVGVLSAFNNVKYEWFTSTSQDLVPFRNLVLNRKTGETTLHSPEYGFFHTLEFDYDPRATAPRWEKFIQEISNGDEDIASLLEEYGGYCISGDSCWPQKALFLVGEGANGKSVYMEILGLIAGKEAHAAVPLQDLEKETARYRLVNKLFNYSEETSTRALQDSSIFKTLVNGGAMQVKQLYIQPYEVDNRAKLIMSANEMPHNQDMSHGFFRRLLLVELKKQFNPGDSGHDPFIKEKLQKELAGICNRLMAAYNVVQTRKGFSAEAKVRTNIQKLKLNSDTVCMFVNEHIEKEPADSPTTIKASELYELYRQMCDVKGFKPLNSVHFARQLIRHEPEVAHRHARVRIGGSLVTVYKGIKIHKEF